jgi:hypothetical protein
MCVSQKDEYWNVSMGLTLLFLREITAETIAQKSPGLSSKSKSVNVYAIAAVHEARDKQKITLTVFFANAFSRCCAP